MVQLISAAPWTSMFPGRISMPSRARALRLWTSGSSWGRTTMRLMCGTRMWLGQTWTCFMINYFSEEHLRTAHGMEGESLNSRVLTDFPFVRANRGLESSASVDELEPIVYATGPGPALRRARVCQGRASGVRPRDGSCSDLSGASS